MEVKKKSYEELEFSDDFMFKRVMMDPEISKGVLERILGVKIERIEYPEIEKTIELSYDGRGIRMDVYLAGDNTRYDIEMQSKPRKALGKRARYYQSSVDLDAIDKGDDFPDLKDSMIIFICTFDPFGKGRHRYTFKETCQEDHLVQLDDGALKIIFNTTGTQNDVPQDVLRFLKFVEDMNSANADEDELLFKIRKRIISERISAEGRQEYNMFQMAYNDARRDGLEEGREEGRAKGLEEGREEGSERRLIRTVCKKLVKNKSVDVIADELEEDTAVIQRIVDAAVKCAPNYDEDAVYNLLHSV